MFFIKTGNVSELCKAIDISRSTYYEWMDKDKDFNTKIMAEQEGLIDFVESKLFNLIDDKNIIGTIFFLKTKGKKRGYVEKTELEHSGELTLKKIIQDTRPPEW